MYDPYFTSIFTVNLSYLRIIIVLNRHYNAAINKNGIGSRCKQRLQAHVVHYIIIIMLMWIYENYYIIYVFHWYNIQRHVILAIVYVVHADNHYV